MNSAGVIVVIGSRLREDHHAGGGIGPEHSGETPAAAAARHCACSTARSM
ncbi:MAG: hypothetical protein R3D85_15325 [Paracoccaceae bacterium]